MRGLSSGLAQVFHVIGPVQIIVFPEELMSRVWVFGNVLTPHGLILYVIVLREAFRGYKSSGIE